MGRSSPQQRAIRYHSPSHTPSLTALRTRVQSPILTGDSRHLTPRRYAQGQIERPGYPQALLFDYPQLEALFEAGYMNQVPVVVTDVLQTPKSQAHSPVTVRIMRGIAAALPLHPDESTPWEIWNAVALARIHAVNASLQHQALYVGRSCLLLNGIQGWSANPQITIYRPTRRSTSRLPACSVGSTTVPETGVTCSSIPPLSEERRRTNGLETEHPYDALIRCVQQEEPLEAFVLGCMALHQWSNFSMFEQMESRERAEEIRVALLKRLERSPTKRGLRRACAILRAIDPGCENPAEAALLWLVRSISPFPSLTQVHIEVRGRHYYADIVIADLRIIIEFDGIGKLGDNQSDLARAKREWIRRDEDLRDAGWNVIRVSWPDYNDWEGLRLRLMRALGRTSSSLDHRLLWSPPTERCDGRNRRFRIGRTPQRVHVLDRKQRTG